MTLRPIGCTLLLILLGGCTRIKLDVDREIQLTQQEESYTFTLDPVKSEQTIKVTAKADNPVSVLVGLQKNEKALGDEVMTRKASDKTLAKQFKTQEATLEAKVPANESAIVLIAREANKATKVKVKITN